MRAARLAADMPRRALITLTATLLLVGLPSCSVVPDGAARVVEIRLSDFPAAAQIAHSLPLDLRFDDRMGSAQVAHLPVPLETGIPEPVAGYRAGDVAYWVPEQSIIVFLSDGHAVPADGLVRVGHISAGMNDLADCAQSCEVRLVDAAP